MVFHTLYGLVVAAFVLPGQRARRRSRTIQQWSTGLLNSLEIEVVVEGESPPSGLRSTLFVGNHVSWVDIHALNSVHTTRFVAKAEIRQWPLFGFFAERANTLFIEREKRHEAGRIVDNIKSALLAGDCICFFPEGTTTDGSEIRPFKGSLLQAAIEANATVRPFSIHYPDEENRINREMAYWGEMSLLASMRQVIRQRRPKVVLRFASPISAGGHDRRQLTNNTRLAITRLLDLER